VLRDKKNQSDLHAAIVAARTDLTGLSIRDLLRKDYKQVLVESHQQTQSQTRFRVGLSSVSGRDILELHSAARVAEGVMDWMRENSLDVFVLLGSFVDAGTGVFRRNLGFAGLDGVEVGLREVCGLESPVVCGTDELGSAVRMYEQKDISISRKLLMPHLIKSLENLGEHKPTSNHKNKI
jgi:hypothetical protein